MSCRVVLADACDRWPVDTGSAACVLFSPPYNAGIDYHGDPSNDQMPWDTYQRMADHVMAETSRVLITPGGRAWVNVTPSVPATPCPAGDHSGQASADRVSLIDAWHRAAVRADLAFRDTVAWVTPGRGPGTAWGSFQTPSGPNLRGEWEAIMLFSSGQWARPTPPEWKGWQDGEGGWPRLTSNVWKIQPETDRDHPAPFPIELPSRCIRLSTYPGELVVDPFAGSGTTVVAARALGRSAIGLERSPEYVQAAELRMSQGVLFGATNVSS